MPRLAVALALAAAVVLPARADEVAELAQSRPIDRTNLAAELQMLLKRPAVPPPAMTPAPRALVDRDAASLPPAIQVLDASCQGSNCPAQPGQTFHGHDFYQVDTLAAASRFFAVHPDTKDEGWDEVVFWTTFFTTDAGGAYYLPLSNDVRGIAKTSLEAETGSELFDLNPGLGTGSKGFLKGTVEMSDWHTCKSANLLHIPCQSQPPYDGSQLSVLGILGQEVGHRWGAFLHFEDAGQKSEELLGRDESHWSYYLATGGSPMEGNDWQPSTTNPGMWDLQPVHTVRYSPLDRYAMGLVSPDDVPPTVLIREPVPTPCTTDKTHPNVYMGCTTDASTPPGTGAERLGGVERDVTIDEIVQAEGPRSPAFPDAPRVVHLAFALLDLPTQPAGAPEIVQLDGLRRAFTRAFYDATGRRMRAITTLSRRDDLGLFDFTLDAEGWTLDSSVQAQGGALLFPLSGVSTVAHTNLELDAAQEQVLHLKLTASRGADAVVRLGWSSADDAIPAGQTLDVPVPASGKATMLEIPMAGRPGWTGYIHQLELTVVPHTALPNGQLSLDSVETDPAAQLADADGDFVPDTFDDCPRTPDTRQVDSDNDGVGDVCTVAPRPPAGCACSGFGAFGALALAGLLAKRRRRA